jgi:hypothetical protein
MGSVSFFRNLLTKVRPAFTPLERQLLSAVEAGLPPAAAEIFRRQLELVNLVQRHSREVNCYRMEGGRPYRDPALRFPDRSQEREFARARFRVPAQGSKVWQASFYLVEGYFFSIVFDAPAERLQKVMEIEIVVVSILANPLQPAAPVVPQPMVGRPSFAGWLGEWAARYGLREVLQPLMPADRQRRLAEISAKLPQDYLQLTEQTDGFLVHDCKILGLSQSYEISLDGGNYQVLAEIDGHGVLAVDSGRGGRVWFLSYQDDSPVEMGSFREGIEAYLQGGLAAISGRMPA